MEIVFVSRSEYRQKALLMQQFQAAGRYWIDEGGYGPIGAKGAATILDQLDAANYTDLICAVGSGTMMAGLVNATDAHQRVIGISSQKITLVCYRK